MTNNGLTDADLDVLEWLIMLRLESGKSRSAIARKMGCDVGRVHDFETGTQPTIGMVRQYAKALGVKIEWGVWATI